MQPVSHQTCNMLMPPPEGVKDCVALAVHRGVVNNTPAIVSFWAPEPDELKALNAGQKIALVVYGESMPMVWVTLAAEEPNERRN